MAEVRSKVFLSDYAKKYLKNSDPATQIMFNKLVKDLRVDMPLDSAVSEALRKTREGKKLLNTLIYKTKKLSEADQLAFCSLLSKGGLPGDCAQALKSNPEKATQVLSDAPITSTAMKNVKNSAQELKAIFATPEVTNIKSPLVNSLSGQIRPELPSVKYNDITGAMVNTANGEKATAADMKKFEVDNPLKTVAGTEDAFKPIEKSMLKTVGRTLAKIGAPLPTALIDGYFVGKQVSEDKPAAEIAKDPLYWLGLATMSSLTKAGGLTKAGAAAPGTMSSILRMGMSPGLIRGVSRFAGLPGLAISTAMTAYDQYNKYKNEEGLIYNLFNDKAEPIE